MKSRSAARRLSLALSWSLAFTLGSSGIAHGENAAPATAHVALAPIELRLPSDHRPLPVDFASAIRLAAAENLDILQARARLEERRGEQAITTGALLPSVSGGLRAGHIDGEIQASFGQLQRRSFSTIKPGVVVALTLNPGEVVFDLLAAHKRVEAGEFQEEQVTQRTLALVASLYLQLLRAQAEVNIADAAVDTAGELARLARDRHELDVGLQVDVARADARRAREEVARVAAEERFRAASVDLANALRLEPQVVLLPTDAEVRPAAFIDTDVTLDSLLSVALDRHPGLRELAREYDAARDGRSAAWWGGLGPEVYGAFEESAIGRSFDGNNRQIYGGYVGWTLSAASIGEVRVSAARVEVAQLEHKRFEQWIRSEVVKSRDRVLAAEQRMGAARRGLEAANESLNLSRDRFEGGVGLDLEVLEAQEALSSASTSLIGAVVDYDSAQIRLLLALGGVTAEDLVAGFNGINSKP